MGFALTHPLAGSLPFYLENPTSEWYDRVPWLCLDLETTNLEKGDPLVPGNRVVLTAYRAEKYDEVAVFADPPDSGLFSLDPVVLVCHNAKFELGWLMREGIDVTNLLPWDTMLAEYVIAGNKRVPLDLGSTAKRYGLPGKEPVVDRLIKAGVCPSEIPRHWLKARVAYDVETTVKIARMQYDVLKRDGLLNVFFTRCIVTPVLAAIEAEGMTLDPERVEEEYRKRMDEMTALADELDGLTGGINLRSGKQLAEYLYDTLKFQELTDRKGNAIRTAGGQRSTSKATLEALEATTAEQRQFVALQRAFSQVNARLSKSLEFFQGVCREHAGQFRGRFNQAVTQTHRLSSSGRRITFRDGRTRGVQFQNLPREYKRLFASRVEGRSLVETDGAQLEFRVAGQLGNDPRVLADVESGADIHRFTASVLLGKSEADVTDKQRTAAKPDTFKPLYGGMSGTPAQVRYYEAFRQKYKGTFDTQTAWTYTVLADKKLRIASGLIFYWPDTKLKESNFGGVKKQYVTNTPSIFNFPIQSFATADIIPISLVYTYWGTRHLDAVLINTVHDSVVADVADEDVPAYKEAVASAWLDKTYNYLLAVYGVRMTIPLGIESKVGRHWGTGAGEKLSRPCP